MAVNPSPCKAIIFSISALDIAVSLRYTLDTSDLALRCVDSRVAARNAHLREAFFIWLSPGIIPMFARNVKYKRAHALRPSPAPRKRPSDRPAVPRRQIPGPVRAARLRPSLGLVSELKQIVTDHNQLHIRHINRRGYGCIAHA